MIVCLTERSFHRSFESPNQAETYDRENIREKWADNRQRLLQEDEEYQCILRSYRKHNWADALVAPAALIGSMEFVAWLGVKSQVLNFVISLVLAIVFFFVFLYFKAVRVSRKTLDEVEQRIKEEYRQKVGG